MATVAIHLLGKPSLHLEGTPVQPRGHKVWALAAYLRAAPSGVSRHTLTTLLFEGADDPMRALRWTLSELRKSLPGGLTGDPIRLDARHVSFDLDVLETGSPAAALSLPGFGRDLLEGISFAEAPGFEAWLMNERRYVRAATQNLLREAALGALACGDHERAIDLATRLLAIDVLDESSHTLLIRAYAASGDHRAASLQVEACRRVLARELGVEPSPAVIDAARTAASSSTRVAAGGKAAVEAQREAGNAAVRAGAYRAGVECLRRAAAEAHSIGDTRVKGAALLDLGRALVHGGHGDRGEGAAALHEAMAADPAVTAEGAAELAWNELLEGRYGRATRWLDVAERERSTEGGLAQLVWMRGKIEMESGRHHASLATLGRAASIARSEGDTFRETFVLISLGRTHLVGGDAATAAAVLTSAHAAAVRSGATVLLPFVRAFASEAALDLGKGDDARELAEQAHALAAEVGDVSMIVLAGRALARVLDGDGDGRRASSLLERCRLVYLANPDHRWSYVYMLDAAAAIAARETPQHTLALVDEMAGAAASSGMRDLAARAELHRMHAGDDRALDRAMALAQTADSPALGALLDSASMRPPDLAPAAHRNTAGAGTAG